MKAFPIPVVAQGFGPGSQPEDEGFAYMPMPKAEALVTPIPPQDASREDLHTAADVIEQLLGAMAQHAPGSEGAPRFSLRALEAGALRALNESLGQGEVSAVVSGAQGKSDWRIQETAFAGVWRVQRQDGHGRLIEDLLEAADMPGAVGEALRRTAGQHFGTVNLGAEVMNVPALLNEIRHHAARFRPGKAAHVMNLSLLPLTPADLEALDQFLGTGPVAILSRGFGNCRISSTRVAAVWRVRYFNSMNTLILDTIEVVDLPEAARAAAEDFEDSTERLHELLSWLREG